MAQRALRPNLPFHAPLQTRARKNLFVTTCPFDSNPGMRVATNTDTDAKVVALGVWVWVDEKLKVKYIDLARLIALSTIFHSTKQ
ncbi:hypothetical protein CPAR01_08559 [Colletotrichum paranaense]|uniref:Uncharacterized protein n=1 Tax=Colletotrichum paranaense TaxID=1914294 RepID=A0ABQ9SKP2_9PEZI|nr:uncharacterized protein CPAR01_08559 [Colletotrichum paranaense]KAK1538446.1 hypothetical protein CPAR01_08559 [Colletotrichum paranaense]